MHFTTIKGWEVVYGWSLLSVQGSTKRVDKSHILNTLKYDIIMRSSAYIVYIKPSFDDIVDSINN